ncbi:MAG: vesicle formation at the endoplasmic reticulum [Phylliscum demangeonii]|nr:MAG: vesicle formation at the endoplasmic reticulum [Phylliscum demangeonii]
MYTLGSWLRLWLLVSTVPNVCCAPAVLSNVLEQLSSVPDGWLLLGKPEPERRVRFRIALRSPNQALFEQRVLEISTPDHPRYGQHMKRNEMKGMLRPAPEATQSTLRWLHEAGVPTNDIEEDGEWISFTSELGQAETVLNATFYRFRSKFNEAEAIRTLEYSVPQRLHRYVEMVQPTTRFGQIRPQHSTIHDATVLRKAPSIANALVGDGPSKPLDTDSCNSTMTPLCLRDLYDMGDYRGDPGNGNKLGIAGYLGEEGQYDDLKMFCAQYAPYASGHNFTFRSINGGQRKRNATSDSVEANLDIQYSLGLSYPTPSVYYATAGRGPLVPDLLQPSLSDNQNEPYLDFLDYMLQLPDDELPQTLTTSYGEEEQSLPVSYTRTICSMFAQLGARGVSVVFSSGDTGPGMACMTNDGTNTTRFQAAFPASCPWVTAVGGTVHVNPEEAVSFSSGGFSDRFSRPAYQHRAVAGYLTQLGDRFAGLYNPGGRAIPDVAAQGFNFHVIDKGQDILVGGTSASAPTFAGIVSLLNSARLSAGKRPLGFLNPWIYAKACHHGLTDITHGGSVGCFAGILNGSSFPGIPYAGWNATEGWDPATGLGTPVFSKLLTLI